MTWEEIEESFSIVPIWLNHWLTINELNRKLDPSRVSLHYNYSLEEFRTVKTNCSWEDNISKVELWKYIIKLNNK